MPTLLESMKRSYAKAEATLVASVKDAERASKTRLAALLKKPRQDRFDHLGDPSLTLADALKLTRSLQSEAKPTVPKRQRLFLNRLFGRWRVQSPVSPFSVVTLTMLVIFAGFVWFRTPTLMVLTQPVTVTLQYPNGQQVNAVINPGYVWGQIRSHREFGAFRIWMPMTGYQEFEVPASIFRVTD